MRKSNVVSFLVSALVVGAALVPATATANTVSTFPGSMCAPTAGSLQAFQSNGAPEVRSPGFGDGDLFNDVNPANFPGVT